MTTIAPSDDIQAKPTPQPELLAEKSALDAAESHAPSTTASSFKDAPEETAKNEAALPPSGPVKVPFPYPLPHCTPVAQPELTPEQTKKYGDLLKLVESWTEIPAKSGRWAKKEPITADEKLWLTKECLLRYLRATKWSATEAPKRLLATLTWRREYGVYTFTPDYISEENETGKQVILGFDNNARPCLYLNPSKQNTAKSDKQLHHLVFMLERVIDLMVPGQESIALLINFKETGSGGQSGPSVGQGKETLNILQGHYPERLGRALISELPWYITTFFKFVSPFIDPITKSKMKFNEPLTGHIPAPQLHKNYGGEVDFEYQHDVYWPALNRLCEERRKAYRDRWVEAGEKVGVSEFYLRGGTESSTTAVNNATAGIEKLSV
ncbi:hypothetical protein EG328_004585 [Venturia inaequalis]|uniref:CRAL-TRIO domain-containing protein n=1 Tax=Venturia inaequalis TaxID=5025 RepID=A0A8H3VE73_VENIN|nr:hypothetical protein EG328_004585 [Venturia inaequalis]